MRSARTLLGIGALACFAGAGWLAPPSLDRAREFAAWFGRPALLPFAWDALASAREQGDAAESFARAQQILDLLPTWTDGHVVFAYRYALSDDERGATPDRRGAAAFDRLQIALAWLETARAHAGRREVELLQMMSMLPEIAVAQEPALAERLRPTGGAPALADHYLAEAERLGGGRRVREHRTFLAPRLCAALLASGDPLRALAVLDDAVARSAQLADRALAEEWQTRLGEARRNLAGARDVDLGALRADPRFAPLLPYLR